MSAGLTTYNYFMSDYANSVNKTSRYDAHKKSELKGIYNSIVKMNKDNPLYMFKKSQEATSMAVNIKESARELTNTLASIAKDRYSDNDLFDRRVAYSSDADILDVNYIGEDSDEDFNTSFKIEVQELAKPQVNTGKEMFPNDDVMLRPGDYSFDVGVNDINYEMQFSVNPGENNETVLNRIAKLFNKSSIGINATIESGEYGQIFMNLTSTATGEPSYGDKIFDIMANDTTGSEDVMEYFGLDNMTQQSSNSAFLLNGTERSSFSNEFTVNKNFEISLKDVSEGSEITIGFKTAADSISDNISKMAEAYNHMLTTAEGTEGGFSSTKLVNDMAHLSGTFKNEFEALGINVEEDGKLAVNEELLISNLNDDRGSSEVKEAITNFENSLSKLTKKVLLNPMEYTDKTLVAYKNPQVPHLNTPYTSSAYSGMMFNSYC
ncbi:MAG: hypothetical protein E7241_10300 [Lachnospiraceae bacterium]|jgi:flagellar hook-associated protein 2|nr:hypothetical protein [Lachnospiraceae bacterium]